MTSRSGRSFITCPMQPRRSPPCNSSSVTNAPRRNTPPGTSGNSGGESPASAAVMALRASASSAARSAGVSADSGSAMVFLSAPDRERAVELLVHDHARQLVRQRQRAEAPGFLCAPDDALRQAVGVADHERDVAALHLPAAGQVGKLLRRPCLSGALQRDDTRILGGGDSRLLHLTLLDLGVMPDPAQVV